MRLFRRGAVPSMVGAILFPKASKGFDFNGLDQWASMPPYQTLGDPAKYRQISYRTDNDDGNVIGTTEPLTEFARVGANYHDGTLKELAITDNSPVQGVDVNMSPGTLPDINMERGSVSCDAVVPLNGVIFEGFLTITGGVLSVTASAGDLVVDGDTYTGWTLRDGQHCKIAFATSGGVLSRIGAALGMRNLLIGVEN